VFHGKTSCWGLKLVNDDSKASISLKLTQELLRLLLTRS
jgi:hypothetical protein